MKGPTDLLDMNDNELAALADTVFRQGLKDGRERPHNPRTADAVCLLSPPYARSMLHKRKFRQIYGAGFDMAKLALELGR